MICAICGKEFEPKTSRQLTCSPECSVLRERQKRKEKRFSPKLATCIVCGKEFTITRKDTICCSPECKRQRNCQVSNEWHRKKKLESRRIRNRGTLDTELAALNSYNDKFGTHLSYGQFQALKGGYV